MTLASESGQKYATQNYYPGQGTPICKLHRPSIKPCKGYSRITHVFHFPTPAFCEVWIKRETGCVCRFDSCKTLTLAVQGLRCSLHQSVFSATISHNRIPRKNMFHSKTLALLEKGPDRSPRCRWRRRNEMKSSHRNFGWRATPPDHRAGDCVVLIVDKLHTDSRIRHHHGEFVA